ncbi:MAG TPA: glycosyltransferase family 39 protein [Patescibacteria group bacterium]|nr:glycosyltransferase family 39 protein [Patescibacteria group bacterium]
MKKFFNFNNLVVFLGIIAILFCLALRFDLAMNRFFDEDEFRHLYRSYLLAQGQMPYRDFGYSFSPFLIAYFAPLFLFLKEGVVVLFFARALNFLVFLATLLVLFYIGNLAFNRLTGVVAAFFWALLPLNLSKTIEIRPDNFSLLFWLASFLFLLMAEKKKKKRLFLLMAGFTYGLAFLILMKVAFGYLGLFAGLLFVSRGTWKKLWENFFFFHLGVLIPFLALFLFAFLLGDIPKVIYSVFLLPYEINRSYGKMFFDPIFPFIPNDAFYGLGGRSLPWCLTIFVIFLGVAGLIKQAFQAAFKGYQLISLFLIFSFLGFAFLVFFFIYITLLQNYLPLLVILCLLAAIFLVDLGHWLQKKIGLLWLIGWLSLFSLSCFGLWQSERVQTKWKNTGQLQIVNNILLVSEPGDAVYDMTGYHLYRQPGYFYCCEPFPLFVHGLSQPFPSLTEELRRNQTKFIYWNKSNFWTLATEDVNFLKQNYLLTGLGDLYVVGKKIVFSGNQEMMFEILAEGEYQIEKESQGRLIIDGQEIKTNQLYLNNGWHQTRGEGIKGLILKYKMRSR